MSQRHVTAKGNCMFCGSKLRKCTECDEWFCATNKAHLLCSSRCRTRKSRRLKIIKEISAYSSLP